LRRARKAFGLNRLCLAGGVALNCSMNGKIEASGIFDEIFVQPASGDNGTVIGACYLSHANHVGGVKPKRDFDNLKGSRFTEAEIAAAFRSAGIAAARPADPYALTAKKLAEGKIVGWFQGGAEFGPRALGNRSILTRPYPAKMKDYLNARVKFREEFRPFAPAVLAEFQDEYFTVRQDSPHMLIACQVRPDKRDAIPAVVHVDESCRVQTVRPETNQRFYSLLTAFHAETACPVLLNTSFNVKGQPIVNTPEEAIACFRSTNIDVLVVGDFYVEKSASGEVPLIDAADVESDRAAV
jgi:carbamoyltransferase